ncbi:MAG: ABC transporter ATP-binding protein [Fulvivirga sp.]|nr:ABC transporter ATP-binding protein [Fulvivirga sp.]
MNILQVKGISKDYTSEYPALHDIHLSVTKSSKFGIVGETGSGKSTLLRIIAGLEQPDKGDVYFNGKRVVGPHEQLVAGHNSIGYLTQNFALPRFITVEEAIYDPYKIEQKEVEKLYEACRVNHLIDKQTDSLSGGEKQRVALARMLVDDPELILLDEPFSNLDLGHQSIIKSVIENISDRWNKTIIMVSHEPRDTLSLADELLVLKKGNVVQTGKPKTIYQQPISEYVARLFGQYNLIDNKKWNLIDKNFFKLNGKIFLRPENISLQKGEKGLGGIVSHIRYYGWYDEIEIESDNEVLVAYAQPGIYNVGDAVGMLIEKA